MRQIDTKRRTQRAGFPVYVHEFGELAAAFMSGVDRLAARPGFADYETTLAFAVAALGTQLPRPRAWDAASRQRH